MTDYKNLKLIATSNPHIRGSETTRSIMLDVIIAMLPALIWGIFKFGLEALILTAVDISGRGMLCYGLDIPTQKVGTFDTELTKEFLLAFARRSDMTVHVTQLAGENSHHIIEGAFKSLARSLGAAVAIAPRFSQEIPSTKGVL